MSINAFTRFKRKFAPDGSFASNALILMTGTSIAQVIPIAVSPILTRIYLPSSFGLLALFISMTGIISVVAAGRYEFAVMLPDKDAEAINISALALVIATLTSVVVLFVIWLWGSLISNIAGLVGIGGWIYFIPLAILFLGMYQILFNWVNRKKKYTQLSMSRLLQAGVVAIIQVTAGFIGFTFTNGLILGWIIGQGIATCLLAYFSWQDDRELLKSVNRKEMVRQAIIHQDFPKINVLHSLSDNINASGTIFILSYFFGIAEVGHYSLLMRVLTAPIALIGSAVTQVFYQKATQVYNQQGDLKPRIIKLLKTLSLIALIPAIIILLFGPELFSIFFGESWRISGTYARMLIPYTFMQFLATPLAFIPFIVKQQRKAFLFSLSGNILYISCIVFAGYRHDITLAFTLISVLMTLYFMAYMAWIIAAATKHTLPVQE